MKHQTPPQNARSGQFQLLREKRFLPFFSTQFLGAFNDNIFKNALILLIAYDATRYTAVNTDILNNIAAGLFILPFFLFSAMAGQLADKYEKASMIRYLKTTEIGVMLCAAVAFYLHSLWGLLGVLFLMGAQSAFFGPVKYSIIPQHLQESELVAGNALVEMGTFMAILLGTAIAGVLMLLDASERWISLMVCTIALAGWLSSLWIPRAPATAVAIRLNWNLLTASTELLRYTYRNRTVFLCVLGISWFWFLGASYLTQLPNFTIEMLSSQKSVVTLLLCVFSVGIGVGSMLCDRLSGQRIEIGIVPLGSLGLSLFGIDLYFASQLPAVEELRSLQQFLAQSGAIRVLLDIGLIGVFGGFFIVPLYATVQKRTEPEHRARVIAANNVLNALFMVAAALTGILLLAWLGLSKAQYFLVLAVINIVVAWYIYAQVPEFGMRFLVWLLSHTLYRVVHTDLEKIPARGPVVLVCNHVSYVDALLLAGAVRRPIRFVMYKPIYDLPLLNYVFRAGRAIPIVGKSEDPEAYEQAFQRISEELEEGQIVCIFPEGQLTKTGEIGEFKTGIEKIVQRNAVPVVPLALKGLWGSFFSHRGGRAFTTWPRRLRARIEVAAGEPVGPADVSAATLFSRVQTLRGEMR